MEEANLSEQTGENPESDAMVLAGLLPFLPVGICKCEPNTHLNSGLDRCEDLSDESKGTHEVNQVSTALKGDNTVQSGCVFDSCLSPLLQSLGHSIGEEYWLVDSGASCCVINQTPLEKFAHGEIKPCGATSTAANWTSVAFIGKSDVVLKVQAVTTDSARLVARGNVELTGFESWGLLSMKFSLPRTALDFSLLTRVLEFRFRPDHFEQD